MGQNEKVEKAPKTSWFSGLKAEFQKIIWPEKQSVIRQTIAVLQLRDGSCDAAKSCD